MNLSRYEQETVINYNNEESFASVYTRDPVIIRKLDKLCDKYPDAYKLVCEDDISKTYEFSKKLVRFGAPVTRIYTEEEKERLREQLKNIKK